MSSRPLTDGEIKLAQSIFGDSIDYARVQIHNHPHNPFQNKHTAMAPNGEIYMPKVAYHDDYSVAAPRAQALFIHEMTHVWQYQNKILHPVKEAAKLILKHRFNYAAAYPYVLEEEKDLTDYGLEQQASIIEDFFLAQKMNNMLYTRHCKNTCRGQDERKHLFEAVLKLFFKNPAYARRKNFPGIFA